MECGCDAISFKTGANTRAESSAVVYEHRERAEQRLEVGCSENVTWRRWCHDCCTGTKPTTAGYVRLLIARISGFILSDTGSPTFVQPYIRINILSNGSLTSTSKLQEKKPYLSTVSGVPEATPSFFLNPNLEKRWVCGSRTPPHTINCDQITQCTQCRV